MVPYYRTLLSYYVAVINGRLLEFDDIIIKVTTDNDDEDIHDFLCHLFKEVVRLLRVNNLHQLIRHCKTRVSAFKKVIKVIVSNALKYNVLSQCICIRNIWMFLKIVRNKMQRTYPSSSSPKAKIISSRINENESDDDLEGALVKEVVSHADK